MIALFARLLESSSQDILRPSEEMMMRCLQGLQDS